MRGKTLLFHKEVANTEQAITLFIKELNKLPAFSLMNAIFCMEHTGIYNNHLLVCLHKKKANIWLESAMQIKRSSGNIRGKNDKVDAIRIADYAYTKRDKVRLWTPKREVIQQLANLTATRARLIEAKKNVENTIAGTGKFQHKKCY